MSSLLVSFLREHPVFRREEVLSFLSNILGKREANRRIRGLLGYQVKTKAVESLRHGLYVTCGHGHPKASPYLIAGTASEDAVIGFQAALAWHLYKGKKLPKKIHVFATGLRSDRPEKQKDSLFIPVQARLAPGLTAEERDGVQQIRVQGRTIRMTTCERTIVDVLDRPDLSDNVRASWKALGELSGPLDIEVIACYLRELECASTTAKVGYFLSGNLERFGLTGTDLKVLPIVPTFPHPWEKGAQGKPHPVWNIIVPPKFKLANAEAFNLETLHGQSAGSSSTRLIGGRNPHQIDLLRELPRRFGKNYIRFLQGQKAIILAVLEGRDALAILPTGAGKSLTYQFPAKFLNGVTLVISPLLSLMEDQVREARSKRLCAIALRSTWRKPRSQGNSKEGAAHREINAGTNVWGRFPEVAHLLAEGKLDLLFMAPESVQGVLRRLPQLQKAVVQIVVDEAHLIHTWGRDFREGYRRLGFLREAFPSVPFLALTATATPSIRRGVLKELRFEEGKFEEQRLPVARLRLFLRRQAVANGKFETRFKALLSFIKDRDGQAGIVFCPTRKDSNKVAERLKKDANIAVRPYNAGMTDAKRRAVQNAFVLRKRCEIVAATVAFGMGVNKKNVRWVVHFGLPGSLEAYVQEVGRAGREGKWAECLLIHAPTDPGRVERRLDAALRKLDPALDPAIQKIKKEYLQSRKKDLKQIIAFSSHDGCLHQFIGHHFDEVSHPCAESCEVCMDPEIHHLLRKCPPPALPPHSVDEFPEERPSNEAYLEDFEGPVGDTLEENMT